MIRIPPSLLVAIVLLVARPAAGFEPGPRLRYPIGAASLADGSALVVANERSGSVSLVDADRGAVLGEATVGERLSSLAVAGDFVLVTDPTRHELIALAREGNTVVERARLRVARYPHSVAVSASGSEAFVATLWSRQLQRVAIIRNGEALTLRVTQSLPLPFAARRQVLLPDGRHLVVADGFGGRLAVVDLASFRIVSDRDTGGHNLYGLAWDSSGERLLVAQQVLNQHIPTTLDNIQWGSLLKNVVRVIPRDLLLDPAANLETACRLISLGQEGDGSADPTAVLPLAGGGMAVALGGTSELVVVDDVGLVARRLEVGKRPLALLPGKSPNRLLVVSQFDDKLEEVDTIRGQVVRDMSLGPQPALELAERGERLFYDARLSFDRWMSCHSCHAEGHTHGLRVDTFGDSTEGAPKRTLTLLGTRDTDRWAWTGEIKELHEQVRRSVESSMQARATADELFALTTYLHTLDPPPPLLPAESDADREQIERGRRVFERQRCNQCHIGPLTYTSHDAYDVGLADERGQAKFNPPSLRGVSQQRRLFHDNRASSLEDVLDVYGHQLREPLSDTDRADLLRFLRSL